MRQSLQLKLGQQLTMTPQLQQAIRLLQLSSLDLQTEIQTVLDSNLMLEREDESSDYDTNTSSDTDADTNIESPDNLASSTDTTTADAEPIEGFSTFRTC